MEKEMITLIENSLNNNEDKHLISSISSRLNIDIAQTKLMIKYISRFCILSSLLDSKYMNYFNEINLFDLREKDELNDENFANAIVIFIKGRQNNKNLYMVKLESEDDIRLNILVLSQLDYLSFEYNVSYNQQLNLINNLDIFKYIYNLKGEYDFKSLSEYLVEHKIDSPLIPYLNLNNDNYSKILEYSKIYPNRIRFLDCYGFDKEKLESLIELNKNSLKLYPHGIFKYLYFLPNATEFNLIDLNLEGFDESSYYFSKIKNAYVDNIELNQENNYIKLLNKFSNIEYLSFSSIDSETLFKIIENIKCNKIKKISALCEDLDEDYNYENVFRNLPLLESIQIEEHQTMNWTYEISNIFSAERKRISFIFLEQLIRNYLNESNDRDLEIQFDYEFDQFWDYFKTKKDIISRISKLFGEGVPFSLKSYFKGVVNKYYPIDKIQIANYKFFYVDEIFDEKIFEFVKNNKIECLFIKRGGKVNFNDLINCEGLKFVFDNSSKTFLFKINGILKNF